MPQMAPMNWLFLYMFFLLIFFFMNFINYYMFLIKNTNLIKNNKFISKTLNWKW
uniref:ATP synthase complex subunit 8 n=1 Tax=Pterostichus niger TaxID=106386 RepID=A0A191ZRY8_PTENI|nr:ATP synthase F0 subunit 8 [Pterostichus niger]ANJ70623.1 ATP synthase F0 subunit 8 [Pterostichus niger]QEI26047.1 ATP synthase F0 subunit 8 [Pterostichus niger]